MINLTNLIKKNKIFLYAFIIFNIYILSWNYSYLIISEGWFLLPAKLISEGKLPYKDFYAYLPPFYYWYSYFIYSLGDSIIYIARIIGQLVFCLIFFFTYKFFRINFSKIVSVTVTFVSLLIYLNTNAIFTYDFTHLVTLFYLISFFFLIRSNKSDSCAFFSGFFGTLLVLTKQSNGSVIFIFLVIIFLLINKENLSRIYIPILGALLAGLPFLIHIISYGGFEDFIDQVVFQAGSTKGGIYHSLTTLFPPTSNYYSFNTLKYFILDIFFPLFIFIFISIRSNKNLYLFKDNNSDNNNIIIFYIIIIASLVAIFFDFPNIKNLPYSSDVISYFWNRAFVWSGYYVCVLFLLKKYNFFQKETLVLLFSLIFASATSAGLTPTSIYLHLGFLFAILLSMKSIANVLKYSGLIFLLVLTVSSIQGRSLIQYQWWGYLSLKGVNVSNEIPSIRNIKNQTISGNLVYLNKIISNCSIKPKNLLPFPHAPLINLTTGINPPGKFTTYWFDFASNKDVEDDLERIKKIKVDVVSIVNLNENAYSGHNKLFRGNKGLSQTKMLKYLKSLVSTNEYVLLMSKEISGSKVDFYFRKNLGCYSQ